MSGTREPNAMSLALVMVGQGWSAVLRQWTPAQLTPRRLRAAILILKNHKFDVPPEAILALEKSTALKPTKKKSDGDMDFKVTTNGRASIPVSDLLGIPAGHMVRVSRHVDGYGCPVLTMKPADPQVGR
jgi:hypothetical protein